MRTAQAPQERTNGRSRDVAALLEAARAVLENRVFADAAKDVLAACKTILGADAGFVALCAKSDQGLDVVHLDPGSLRLDPARLPASVRRLSARAAKGQAVFANDLSKDRPTKPAGRQRAVRSALIVPIVIAGEVTGLLGLIDRPDGFTTVGSQLAEVFAEMAAVAMLNSRTVGGLEKNRRALERDVRRAKEQLETLIQNLPDLIARFDPQLRYLYVSPAIERTTGRTAQDYLGRTSQEAGMVPELGDRWDDALRRVFASGRPERFELAFAGTEGVRHFDCRLVPEIGPTGEIPSVLSVSRDVTEKWLAHQAELRARHIAEALRDATVALTRSLDRETVLTTLLDRLRAMVPFDRAAVMLLEAASRVSVRAVFDGERVVPLPPEVRTELNPTDHSVVKSILTTGAAVVIPDVRVRPDWNLPTDPSSEASWMGVPLFARGDVTGLFSLSKREPGYFNEEHVRLAEAMSSQASVAVENAILFEQMQAATARMQALSRRLVEVQEEERRRIARELHDEAGQVLTSLRFGLLMLKKEADAGGSVDDRVVELIQQTDSVIDGLHRLAIDLRPPSLDHLGLEAVVRQLTGTAAANQGLEIRFKARGFTGRRLPPVIETALYRVVQEAMANVARHAHASRVDLLLEHRGDRAMVMVEDDGVGFEPSLVQRGNHFGLLGLKERAEALHGTLTVESSPGAGTTVVVEVPSADPHPDRR